MITHADLDETLLERRSVVRTRSTDDGIGTEADLSCGHTIWLALPDAPAQMYCGECLDKLVRQAREIQAQQRPV